MSAPSDAKTDAQSVGTWNRLIDEMDAIMETLAALHIAGSRTYEAVHRLKSHADRVLGMADEMDALNAAQVQRDQDEAERITRKQRPSERPR